VAGEVAEMKAIYCSKKNRLFRAQKEETMDRKKRLVWVENACLISGIVLLAVVIVGAAGVYASAESRMETAQLVEKAKMTFDRFKADANLAAFDDLIKHAKGVFIAPQILKGAFIFGASGGSGVFLVWDEKTGKWGGPAFYTIGGASFGLQIGGEASEVILMAMTERGVKAMLSSSFKLGADAGIAAGPIGVGAAASTANLSADLISFSRAKGLYGGVSLDGAIVAVREGWNNAYYGRRVDPIDILILQDMKNLQAAPLIEAVARASGKKLENEREKQSRRSKRFYRS
jgi:SH3 domain-containing YSC84-like protein 1